MMMPYVQQYAVKRCNCAQGAEAREEHEVSGGILRSQRDGVGQDQRTDLHRRTVRVAERGKSCVQRDSVGQ